jgi:SpoVK/Ycf46/Vps4 family AAA+-type ATPase
MAERFRTASKTLVITAPTVEIPVDLEKDVHLMELPLPRAAEFAPLVDEVAGQAMRAGRLAAAPSPDIREQLLRAMAGFTIIEAENALVKAIYSQGNLGEEALSDIVREKEQVIRKSGSLEFFSSPERFGTIGGLDLLKSWLQQRALAFTESARAFGLPEPRGLLLLGVPGCGKSLCAKAIAVEWQMPLLRFDIGSIFARYVGQAEENMRRALRVAEGVAPAILWIDEIEKGLAGAGGDLDSGVTSRVFGTLLTWMQEKTAPVFLVATANDIAGLPPE